jgi:hypothetical protein
VSAGGSKIPLLTLWDVLKLGVSYPTGASVADFVATLKSPVPTRPPLRKGKVIPSLLPMMRDQSSKKEQAMRVQEVSWLVSSTHAIRERCTA